MEKRRRRRKGRRESVKCIGPRRSLDCIIEGEGGSGRMICYAIP